MGDLDPDKWLLWTGLNYDADTIAWLKRSPGAIFWLEGGLFVDVADLVVTWEGETGYPIRVPPGWWLHFDGKFICAFERGPQ